jgi:hypothetical protein
MDERERRVVENESRFRLVNERIRAVVSGDESAHHDAAEDVTVICECGYADCTEAVSVPLSGYEWARADPARFVIAVSHELPEYERIVRDGDGYRVVKKIGDAQQLAAAADPRRAQD